MSMALNSTHDSARRSWVASANAPGGDFPIQNLPHGVFSAGSGERRGGLAIGAQILDLGAVLSAGLIPDQVVDIATAAAAPTLNGLIAMGNDATSRLRMAVFDLLADDTPAGKRARVVADRILVPQHLATLHMPLRIGSFTDFMTSVHHVTAARRARPARPLNDNFLHLPVAYNSRATSITEDGVALPRPWGQRREADGAVIFAPTASLDFELEFGALIGPGNTLGDPIPLDAVSTHIFGYVLVNDWSARDIQLWEMRLGPFLGKSFRSTMSSWIITAEALAPFQVPAPVRTEDQPHPLPYLDSASHRAGGALNIALEAHLSTAAMRNRGDAPARIVRTNLLHCAWTLPQMIAHHTSNGCNLEPGDLISSGTVSGPTDEAAACLFESTAGTLPLHLPGGDQRTWLEDGDRLILTGRAERAGFIGIGFGTCGAEILPARPFPQRETSL